MSDSDLVGMDWVERGEDCLRLRLDTQIYSPTVVFRTCYLFTDRAYLYLHGEKEAEIIIDFRSKMKSEDLTSIVGEFGNELINQRVRAELASETEHIRELIVRQAFSEADL